MIKRSLIVLVGLLVTTALASAQTDRTSQVLAAARQALGGAQRLDAVRSLSAQGTYRRVVQGQEMSGDLELQFLLPDHYLRTDVSSFGPATITRRSGFARDKAINASASSGGGTVIMRAGAPGEDPAKVEERVLKAARGESARYLAMWLLAAPGLADAHFSYAGQAEAEDGKADALDLAAADGFALRLFLDVNTHLPLMASYKAPAVRMVVNRIGPGAGKGPEDRDRALAAAKEQIDKAKPPEPRLAEYTVAFSDFESFDGILLPTTLSVSVDGQPQEEYHFAAFKVNPPIKAEQFK